MMMARRISRTCFSFSVILALALSVMLSGCGRRSEQVDESRAGSEEAKVDPADEAFELLRQELIGLQETGDRASLIARLRAALEDEILERYDGTIFAWLLGELSATEEGLAEARALYMAAASENEDRLRSAYGIIDNAYLRMEDKEGVLALCTELLGKSIPQDISTRVWMRLCQIQIEADDFNACVEQVPTIVRTLSPVNAERVLWMTANMLLEKKAFGPLREVLTAVESQKVTDERLLRFILLAKVDMVLAEGNFAAARDLLMTEWASLPDGDLGRRMSLLIESFAAAGAKDDVDALARTVLKEMAGKKVTQRRVITTWIKGATGVGDYDRFVQRVSESLGGGVSIDVLLSPFEAGFYAIMSNGTDAQKDACVALVEDLRSALPADDEQHAPRLAMLLLDGAFYREDFERAMAVIDAGIPGQDEDLHTVLRNKVTAHLALVEGRTDDAVAAFRRHMDTVEGWKQPQVNPESGVMMYKEAVLGFNEKRIGDIYTAADRAAEAKTAYASAREYYALALALVKEDSDEHRLYTSELAEIPATE
jgi:hypothetical protein